MMFSFVFHTRLFSRPVRLDMWLGLIFEALLALLIWGVIDESSDLLLFSTETSPIVTSPYDITTIGLLGAYSIRISMFIAIARRNRGPQVAEWIVFLVGYGIAVPSMLFGGWMLTGYAAAHGYDRCPIPPFTRTPPAVFVLRGTPCPPDAGRL